MLSLVKGVILGGFAILTGAFNSVTPTLLVTDPCRCAASEVELKTQASGTCGNPAQDCFSYSATEDDSDVDHGKCYNAPTCTPVADQCDFGTFTVNLTAAGCSSTCCNNPTLHCTTVKLDTTPVGQLCQGGSLGPIDVSAGPKDCGEPNTLRQLSVECPTDGDVELEVTFIFRCKQCPDKS